jgi:5-methylphenazine-1-carboxylate 1-monooxygenase
MNRGNRQIDTTSKDVIVVGGGIGGLVTALSLHEAGIDVRVFESVESIRALGVGINLLPHAVRELDALNLLGRLTEHSVAATTLAYFTKRGETIWTEQRGTSAGYAWPQLSIHRGTLQTILLAAVIERIGSDRVHTSHQLTEFSLTDDAVTATFHQRADDRLVEVSGAALIAADGIHSCARRQLYPNEGMPKWNGAKLWRGLVETTPVLDGRTMIWCGHPNQKFIAYPVLDLPNGRQLLNFIAELRYDETELAEREDWNQPGILAEFLPSFEDWDFGWINIPQLLREAPQTFLFQMVDRDPLERWSHGRMTLLGDAAHPMYPVGSNGASQAILDARVLAGCMRLYGSDIAAAFQRYDAVRRPATGNIVLANRGFGPELPMKLVEERAPNGFAHIGDVISEAEVREVTDGYRQTAGFALSQLADPNTPSLIDANYRFAQS